MDAEAGRLEEDCAGPGRADMDADGRGGRLAEAIDGTGSADINRDGRLAETRDGPGSADIDADGRGRLEEDRRALGQTDMGEVVGRLEGDRDG